VIVIIENASDSSLGSWLVLAAAFFYGSAVMLMVIAALVKSARLRHQQKEKQS
jgi:hypothetical protein